MATIYRKITLNLPPTTLWSQVADVAGIARLLEVVAHSEVEGQTRTCLLADGGRLQEEIIGVDDTHRRVAYTITRAPFSPTFHVASMQVDEAADGRSAFTWITDITPDELARPLGTLIDSECARLRERFA